MTTFYIVITVAIGFVLGWVVGSILVKWLNIR